MKVKLIGTGSIYTKYNSASTLVDNDLIVDMPNGTMKQLLKINFDTTKIKTILITHLHGDHTADIPFFLKYIFKDRKIDGPINIVGPKGTRKRIAKLFKAYKFENYKEIERDFKINVIEILEDSIVVDTHKIDSYIVIHGEEKPSLGYVIDDKLGLTGDSILCSGSEKIFSRSKLVVSDTSVVNGDRCHMGIDNVKYLLNKYNTKVIPTHLRDITREILLKEKINNLEVVEDFYETEV